jgi:hypothetical protein
MEADWAVEIGPDAPSMDVPWEGFVDLRDSRAEAAERVTEAGAHPALVGVLRRLNAEESPVFTSKCDVWRVNGEEIDSDEFGARAENARFGFASYIDVVLREPGRFESFEFHELLVGRVTERLRGVELANGRVDLIVRAAEVDSSAGFGVTVYAAGCGADEATAYAAWKAVLGAAVDATMSVACLVPERASSRASSSIG